MAEIKNLYSDVKRRNLPRNEGKIGGQDYLDRVSGMQIGAGSKVWRSDQTGQWMGAAKFENAKFSVDMDGNLIVTSATFKDENNITIIDAGGLVSTANFISDSYRATSTVTINNSFSFTDIAGSSLTFSLDRSTRILITFFANVKSYATDSFREYYIDVAVDIDGTTQDEQARYRIDGAVVALGSCLSLAKTYVLSEGSHTIKLQWAAFSDDVNEMFTRGLDYCILGS
ncbi:MAG TPA: hypothetical protein ENI23_12340 [bacterium]|nr:hypothetical protein [bacterium]